MATVPHDLLIPMIKDLSLKFLIPVLLKYPLLNLEQEEHLVALFQQIVKAQWFYTDEIAYANDQDAT